MSSPTIFHIADIHIRRGQHARIKYAFDQLIEKITNHTSTDKYLVIAGDVFEYKSQVSQQDLDCFHYLLGGLQIPNLNIITIPGNHDYSISSNLDFLKVALTNTNYKNVFHYPDSGIFNHGDIDFHVLSPMDMKIPEYTDQQKAKFKVALLHEPITGCSLYGSQQQLDGRFKPEELSSKYDLTLAGDLHKRQRLKPNVAYSGSLVQKNKGEGLVHGGIVWTLETNDANSPKINAAPFNLMQKDVFLIINFIENEMVRFKKDYIESIQYLEIRFKDTDLLNDKCKPALAWIKKNYGKPHKWTDLNEIVLFEDEGDAISQSQIDLIKKKTDREDILQLHLNKLEKYTNIDDRVRWDLKYLKWSNLFCFGLDNSIDFTKLKSLSSIIGPNGTGKSSILDVLLFVLYNYRNRGDDQMSMIREGQSKYSIDCGFSVGTKTYRITRSGDNKKNVKYMLLEQINGPDGVLEKDITGADINEMYQTIKSLIGNQNDFLNTNMRVQNAGSFVEKTKTEQSKEIKSYLNLNILTQIHKDTKSKITNLRKKIKTLANQVSSSITQETIVNLKSKLQIAKNEQEELEISIQDLTVELTDFHLYKTNELTSDIPRLEKELTNIPDINTDSDTTELQTQVQKIISEHPDVVRDINLELNNLKRQIPKDLESRESLLSKLTPDEQIQSLQKPSDEELNTQEKININQKELQSIPNFNPLQRRRQLSPDTMIQTINNNTQTEMIQIYSMDEPQEPVKPQIPTKPECLKGEKFKPLYDSLQISLDKIKKSKEIHIPQTIQESLTWALDCPNCSTNKTTLINPPSDEESNIEEKIRSLNAYRDKVHEYRIQHTKYEQDLTTFAEKTIAFADNNNNKDLNNKYQMALDCQNDIKYLEYETLLQKRKTIQQSLEDLSHTAQKLSSDRATRVHEHIKNNQIIQEKLNQLNTYELNQEQISKLEKLLPYREVYLETMSRLEKSQRHTDIVARKKYLITVLEQLKSNKSQELNQSKIHNQLKISQQKLKELNESTMKMQKNLTKYEMDLNLLTQIKESETELSLLLDYNKYVVDPKTGIQEALVVKQRTVIENTTNSILQDLTDFTVKFDADRLMIRRNKKLTSASLASGAMKFMIDIALRLTLTNLHPFNPPLLFLDEGFGSLDGDHANNVRDFLTQIKNNTKIVFIIHLEYLKNIAEPIKITSDEGVSKVVY